MAAAADDESRTIELLENETKRINALDDKWISRWAELIEKYFKKETRNSIRLKAIYLLSHIFIRYHVICEDELMNKIISPYFTDVDQENDSVFKKPIVHLLFDVASNCLSSKHCNAVLAILRKLLNKPYRQRGQAAANGAGLIYTIGNPDIIDSRLIITNLNKLFRSKLYRLPIDSAVNMLDISVSYLHQTYKCPLQEPVPAELPMIRTELFGMFLYLRCNKFGHLGILEPDQNDESKIEFSPFIICVKRPSQFETSQQQQQPAHPPSTLPTNPTLTATNSTIAPKPPSSPLATELSKSNNHFNLPPTNPAMNNHHFLQSSTNIQPQNIFIPNALHPECPIMSRCVNLDGMFSGLVECINQETDADVLKLVLGRLPRLLANKSLVATINDEIVNQLCVALASLIKPARTNGRQNSKLGQVVKPSLQCLTSLLIYKKRLKQKSIHAMLAAFEESLRISGRHLIVPLFTTCLIELRDSPEMSKFLPVILNHLSKFSPTINLGICMLEFMSYLILFPKLYENFSEDEYKFLFAIALPYTNPFRFSDYITCLAFRVIATWYLNCRPALRCAFVEFIKKSLRSNVLQPFKENHPSTCNASNINTNSTATLTACSHAASPICETPPITYSCPATMSPVDQRKRSLSLNAENYVRSQHQHASASAGPSLAPTQQSLQVNEELIETFADLLARYTHGQCLAIAPKNRSVDLLIDRSTSQTWLRNNSLVTITTGSSRNKWAEILIRRPTGNTSWIGKLQNSPAATPVLNQQVYLESLNYGNDVISLFSTMSLLDDPAIINNSDASSTLSSVTPSLATLDSASVLSQSNAPSASSQSLGLASGPVNYQTASQASAPSAQPLRDPIPLPKDKKFDVALNNLDTITPYETHKVGVVYVARGQAQNRAAILSNKCGSPRYHEFLADLGTCIVLKHVDPEVHFIGGLDAKGDDGKYAYFWRDNVTQVIFHVATCMPNRANDPHGNNKNRHIGNDHVCIAYNDSGQKFDMLTIKGTGQFIKGCITVTPLEDVTNVVRVESLPELRNIVGDVEPRVLSNLGAAIYARQLAIHLNLASKILERYLCDGFFNRGPYVSNWVERLRCIKRIRQRLDEGRRSASTTNTLARPANSLK